MSWLLWRVLPWTLGYHTYLIPLAGSPQPWGEGEVAQLCPTLCDPMDCSPPGSSVHGIFQARILSGLPFPSPHHPEDPVQTPWQCLEGPAWSEPASLYLLAPLLTPAQLSTLLSQQTQFFIYIIFPPLTVPLLRISLTPLFPWATSDLLLGLSLNFTSSRGGLLDPQSRLTHLALPTAHHKSLDT